MIEVDGFLLDERMTDECRAVVLDALKRNNHQITNLEETRRKRNEMSAKRMADLTFDDLVLSEFSVANPTDGYNVQVTCYKPKAATANAPIVVFSHGGGWSVGSRASHHQSVALLASNSQAIWLSVEMRLCPEVKFPTNLNDCIAVVRHVHANKEQFSSESARLGVCGNSSGGHLSSLMSHSMPDLIDFQILIYGTFYLDPDCTLPSHLEFDKDCYLLTPQKRDKYVRNLVDDLSLLKTAELSPLLKENFHELPRTILIAAELDPRRDQSKEYHRKLLENNVVSELVIIKGVHHGFLGQPIKMKNAFAELQTCVKNFLEIL